MRRWILHLLSILALLSLPSIPAMPLHGTKDTPSEGGSLVTDSTETEILVSKDDGFVWKEVAFKMMPLNNNSVGWETESVENKELVPHIWSKQLGLNYFVPICDPSVLAAHLMCRSGGFETFIDMKEVNGSSLANQHFVRMVCRTLASQIEDCRIIPADSCSRLAEITCGTCGGERSLNFNEELYITSPGYPHRILPLSHCEWRFVSPSSENPIIFAFEDFDLPHDCKVAGVRMGSLLRTGQLLMIGKPHCGEEKPEEYESSSTVAVLRYSSWQGNRAPGSVHFRGFKAKIVGKIIKDEMHLGLALGFTAAAVCILIIIACVYHKRIRKQKKENELRAKLYTHQSFKDDGDDLPDHIYSQLPDPEVKIARTGTRKPLQTIYVKTSDKKPELPPRRSPGWQPQKSERDSAVPSSKKEVSFFIPADFTNRVGTPYEPSSGENSYVLPTPNRLLLVKPCPRMAKLKALLGKKISEPVSDGFLGRNISIRRRNRVGSAPVVSNAVVTPKSKIKEESEYISVMNSGSNSSVPVINLLDCDEDGCKFVREL
ncbi:hypothetical protein RvY_09473 [Ramazzottius varieornatus]|uniref:CUB domain-containing protein n=1 Tax=Ramazzottius varieornatus TaxID=947166 RepID=A0A1D1V9F6_RAMVA|nr:hypothetical protein RvY_09473 [Ramazzottius varieornatus]